MRAVDVRVVKNGKRAWLFGGVIMEGVKASAMAGWSAWGVIMEGVKVSAMAGAAGRGVSGRGTTVTSRSEGNRNPEPADRAEVSDASEESDKTGDGVRGDGVRGDAARDAWKASARARGVMPNVGEPHSDPGADDVCLSSRIHPSSASPSSSVQSIGPSQSSMVELRSVV